MNQLWKDEHILLRLHRRIFAKPVTNPMTASPNRGPQKCSSTTKKFLCQLDPVLYEKHKSGMMKTLNEGYRTNNGGQEDVGYQEDAALELIQKLIEYISNASSIFRKCLINFTQELSTEKFDFYDSSSVDAAGIERVLYSIVPPRSASASSQR